MTKRDARVDAYIARSAGFARPILEHLRETVHGACPDVEETIRWGFPHFDAGGMLCSMASFKAHCAFGFRKGALLFGDPAREKDAMGHFGRITVLSDLPPKRELVRLVKAARKLNEEGAAVPKSRPGTPKAPVEEPHDLADALGKDAKARATFDGLPPSHRREYVEWIVGAKRDGTRRRRVAQAVAWLAEGKSRNRQYER